MNRVNPKLKPTTASMQGRSCCRIQQIYKQGNFLDRSESGCKCKLSQQDKRKVINELKKHPKMVNWIQNNLNFTNTVGVNTTKYCIQQNNLFGWILDRKTNKIQKNVFCFLKWIESLGLEKKLFSQNKVKFNSF